MTFDLDRYRVHPGQPLQLATRSTNDDGGIDEEAADEHLDETHQVLHDLQEALYAEGKQSLLLVLQAMDAGGKDSTTEKVFRPLNPQGIR
ncbi:MAG: polyphosphate kinase 2 family protein, partial [Bacteroidota bacterium]